MKVAIVCDWLTGLGGAERVVFELHRLYPEAPIYTSQFASNKLDWAKDADIRTLWLNRLPASLKKFLPPLRAWAFSRLDLSDYDLVLSSTGAEAKAIKIGPDTIHICYLHAPTHYYWSRYDEYMEQPGFGVLNPVARIGLKLFVKPMRKWDKKAAQKPTYIITNSNYSKSQIKKYYGRDSEVIFPPVDIERFRQKTNQPRQGFLIAGRQTPYKKFGLAVAAATMELLDLVVIGKGPDQKNLVKIAGPNVTFLTDVTDQQMPKYFGGAAAFIFPGVDDFGIVAVEALAAGTPVIAFKGGGASDYLQPKVNGLFFESASATSLADTMSRFKADNFDNKIVAQTAEKFSVKEFQTKLRNFVNKCVGQK